MAKFPAPETGILLTHFIVSEDIARSRDFYADVLGGEVVLDSEPTIVALANGWIIINTGGPPTDDKPTVTLTAPDPNTTSSFLNIRVANIQEIYEDWSSKGAQVPDPTNRPRRRDPLLLARPGRAPDRGRPGEPSLLGGAAFTTLSRRCGRQWSQRGDTVSDHGPVSVRDRSAGHPTPYFGGPLPALTVGQI